jgi:hypothetical protein
MIRSLESSRMLMLHLLHALFGSAVVVGSGWVMCINQRRKEQYYTYNLLSEHILIHFNLSKVVMVYDWHSLRTLPEIL